MSTHRKVLVLFFHPSQKTSRVGAALAEAVKKLEFVTFRDMYGLYPDFLIDIKSEQKALQEHELIVFQHPIYWYSCPPLLKLWIDDVFEFGWAYGTEATKLRGKFLLSAVSAGGSADAYSASGSNRFTLETFLSPFDQTASLCGMKYLKPLVVHGSRELTSAQINEACLRYTDLLSHYFESGVVP